MTPSPWTPKCWGRTRCIYDSHVFCGHELEVEEGGYTSIHYHEQRGNFFCVESGKIAVVEFFGWRTKRHILTAGETLAVPSLVVHQFQVLESGKVREDYWADRGGKVKKDDIVRLVVGGQVDHLEELQTLAERLMHHELQG